MRLGFAIASHLAADILLLDEVFAVGDEAFQRKCFGKIFDFKRDGGTIAFVSHDAAAVERLCERAVLLRHGAVEFDGTTHDALTAYHRLLADESDPEERGAGLNEWGSLEARIAEVHVRGADGEERAQFLAGEPFSLQLRVVAERALPPPRLSYELRDEAGRLVAAGGAETADLGWSDGAGEVALRFDVDALPLADGRFQLALGLSDASGEHLYHHLAQAAAFVVYPVDGQRGTVLLEGRWSPVGKSGA